ncbi:uncharacterized protein PF3D7_1120000-like [Erythrolamprus reginae]|uniref:uncharacterized protein PF3D7_1120000-like n=1 Tax=Erythrolamprus reginae TaxID=121349 RepID=UPI00396C615C
MKGSYKAQSVTSVTTTTTQKQTSTPTPTPTPTPKISPTSSPLQQRTIITMLAKEKEKQPAESNLQTIQDTLAIIQDFMQKMQTQTKIQLDTNKEEVKKYFEEMKQEMKNEMGTLKTELKKEIGELKKTEIGEVKRSINEMDVNMKVIQQNLQENEKRIKAMEDKVHDIGQKVEEYEEHNYATCRGFDEAITNLELQSASHGLRFQNIEEEKDEDLSAKMAEII